MPPPLTAATTDKYAASSVQVSIWTGQGSKRRSRRGSTVEPRKFAKMRAPAGRAVVSFERAAGQELSGRRG
jgi:hypothetical protein